MAQEAISVVEALIPAEPEPVTIGSLTVNTSPIRSSLVINERDPITTPTTIELEEGEYQLVISSEGHVTEQERITIVAGETLTLDIELDEIIEELEIPSVPEENGFSETPTSGFSTLQIAGLGLVGAGILSFGGGVLFYSKTASLHDDFVNSGSTDQSIADDGESAAQISTLLYITGTVLALSGGGLFAFDLMQNQQDDENTMITRFVIGPQQIRFSVEF